MTVRIAFGMIVGGAIGNIVDRLHYGYVIDFIDFYRIWPNIFNVADSCITVGVGLLLISQPCYTSSPLTKRESAPTSSSPRSADARAGRSRRALARGDVRVNGTAAKAGRPLAEGRRSRVRSRSARAAGRASPKRSTSRSSTKTPIVIVIDKPAGMVTHPAHAARSGTLVNALLATSSGRASRRRAAARARASPRSRHLGLARRGEERGDALARWGSR